MLCNSKQWELFPKSSGEVPTCHQGAAFWLCSGEANNLLPEEVKEGNVSQILDVNGYLYTFDERL